MSTNKVPTQAEIDAVLAYLWSEAVDWLVSVQKDDRIVEDIKQWRVLSKASYKRLPEHVRHKFAGMIYQKADSAYHKRRDAAEKRKHGKAAKPSPEVEEMKKRLNAMLQA